MAYILFWGSFFCIIFVYAGYPLVISLLALFCAKKNRADDGFTPSITMFVAAYNEEKIIESKIKNMLALDYPKDRLECYILVDESTDKTEEIVARYAADGIRMWVQRPRQGKMSALNAMVPQARGDIVVFSDANSMYKPDALRKLARHFRDEKIGLVCGELRLIDAASMIAVGENFYWRYEKFLKKKESALRQLLVVNGSIYAIRKKLFTAVDPALADDFVIPLRVAAAGYDLIYEPAAINEEKSTETGGDEFRRKVRIISQGLRASFTLWGEIVRGSPLRFFSFLSHKFLRWFVFLFSLVLAASNFLLSGDGFYRMILFAQAAFYAAALAGMLLDKYKMRVKLLFIPYYFCLLNLASARALWNVLFGRSQAMWEKAESTR
ncbi:MAG: glycosyltransferase family 2 protein [Candidatus Omnitrophica bacterium]|nr:glycosyltransferase family 2 protein [Candidatus Omnitrophota bacterium]